MWQLPICGTNRFIMIRELALSDTQGLDVKYANLSNTCPTSEVLFYFTAPSVSPAVWNRKTWRLWNWIGCEKRRPKSNLRYCPGVRLEWLKNITRNHNQDIRFSNLDFNPESPKCEAGHLNISFSSRYAFLRHISRSFLHILTSIQIHLFRLVDSFGYLNFFCNLSNDVHLAIQSGRKGRVILQSLTAVYWQVSE
jgi:hypothetical protein